MPTKEAQPRQVKENSTCRPDWPVTAGWMMTVPGDVAGIPVAKSTGFSTIAFPRELSNKPRKPEPPGCQSPAWHAFREQSLYLLAIWLYEPLLCFYSSWCPLHIRAAQAQGFPQKLALPGSISRYTVGAAVSRISLKSDKQASKQVSKHQAFIKATQSASAPPKKASELNIETKTGWWEHISSRYCKRNSNPWQACNNNAEHGIK